MDRNTPLYDTKLSDRARAEYLVSQMTIEEKFSGSTPELVETRFSERSRNSKFQLPGNQVDHGSEPFVGVEASGLSLLYFPRGTYMITGKSCKTA